MTKKLTLGQLKTKARKYYSINQKLLDIENWNDAKHHEINRLNSNIKTLNSKNRLLYTKIKTIKNNEIIKNYKSDIDHNVKQINDSKLKISTLYNKISVEKNKLRNEMERMSNTEYYKDMIPYFLNLINGKEI